MISDKRKNAILEKLAMAQAVKAVGVRTIRGPATSVGKIPANKIHGFSLAQIRNAQKRSAQTGRPRGLHTMNTQDAADAMGRNL